MGSLLFRERGSPGRALPRHGERKRTCVEECVGERTPVPGLTVREVEMLTQTQRIVVDDGDARGEVLLLDHTTEVIDTVGLVLTGAIVL